MRVINRTKDRVVVSKAEQAATMLSRMRGLLGRAGLDADEGLWIVPCNSIHTLFMRFTIDAVFLDKQGRVLRIYEHLKPWRVTRMVSGARAVLELPAGAVGQAGVAEGDELVLEGDTTTS